MIFRRPRRHHRLQYLPDLKAKEIPPASVEDGFPWDHLLFLFRFNKRAKCFPRDFSRLVCAKSLLAGPAGFEPARMGVKVPCLTAWLRPCVLGSLASCPGTLQKGFWWAIGDSNPEPSGYEPLALPIELMACVFAPGRSLAELRPGTSCLFQAVKGKRRAGERRGS